MKLITVPSVLILLVFGLIGALGCAGYSLGDLVHVPTPPAIQKQFSLPPSMSLNAATRESQIQLDVIKASFAHWFQDIHKTQQMVEGLEMAAFAGINSLIPALGPFAGIAGILGAYFTRRPRDVSPTRHNEILNKEKQDAADRAWDEAAKETKETIRLALDKMGVSMPPVPPGVEGSLGQA